MLWFWVAVSYFSLWLAIQVRWVRARYCKPRDINAST